MVDCEMVVCETDMKWDGRWWDGNFQSHSPLSIVVAVLLKEEVYGKRVERFLSFLVSMISFEEEKN